MQKLSYLILTLVFLVLVTSCKLISTPKKSFSQLKIHYHIQHEGYFAKDITIIDYGTELLLITESSKEIENIDSTLISTKKRKRLKTYIDDFRNHILRNNVESCEDGWSVAGGTVLISLDIDGEVLSISDCMKDELEIKPLLADLKSD